jgi:hypothetical protein
MDIKNLLHFLRIIETIPIEYMVSGSIASILYGKPRLTQDMDVVVVLPIREIDAFARLFDPEKYYCPPTETMREEVVLGEQGHFNIIDQNTGFKIDIYPAGNDSLIAWGLENKKKISLIEGEDVWVAPPEYVILKKLSYYLEGGSQKHLEDIRGMIEVSGNQIDVSIIEDWSSKLGLMDGWKQVSE